MGSEETIWAAAGVLRAWIQERGGDQRRPPLEEAVVAEIGTGTTGSIPVSATGRAGDGRIC